MAKGVAAVLRLVFLIVMAAIILQIPIFSVVMRISQLDHEGCRCNESPFLSNTSQQQQQQDERSSGQQICKNGSIKSSAPRKLKPLGYAHYPFLVFSVYRYELDTFFVIGESSWVVREFEQDKPVYKCEWSARLSNGTLSESPIITEAKMMYVKFDENGMSYGPAIVNCTFNESTLDAADDTSREGRGGVLRLHIARGPNHFDERHSVEVVLHEEPGPSSCAATTAAAAVSKLAFCGPPMFGTMKPEWMVQWLTYHNYLWNGNAHFYFYNLGAITNSSDDRKVLDAYVKAGLLTIIDVESSAIDEFPAWYKHQVLLINDCIHRTRCAGHRWSFFFDFDELLYVSPPNPETLETLIQQHEQAAWITFGNMPASTSHCTADATPTAAVGVGVESRWELERLLWRNKLPECRKDDRDPWLCTGSQGRRKYMVNPSKVFSSGVHRIAVPESDGVDLNASVARVIHFHGALHPLVHLCGIPVNMSHRPSVEDLTRTRYDYDDSISLAVDRARKYAALNDLLYGDFSGPSGSGRR